MILQSLVSYYEGLMARGELAPTGWSSERVSYVLELDADGTLKTLVSLKLSDGKKMVPQKMWVPTRVKRSSGVVPNFLCDHAGYFLGLDSKGNPERSCECFEAAAQLHKKLLADVDDEAATALLKFFEQWDVAHACEQEQIQQYKEDLLKGDNLIFSYRGTYLQDMQVIQGAWQKYLSTEGDEQQGRCMVTGKEDRIAVLHPLVKGIKNAQSSGASLVSYNAPAFCSYGKEKGKNASVGEYAANAYGEALKNNVDYYLWVNNDVIFRKGFLQAIINDALEAKKTHTLSIICGSVSKIGSDEWSYGGTKNLSNVNPYKRKVIIPNGHIQECDCVNGNCLLIPYETAICVGNIEERYEHGFGDFDYGYKLKSQGGKNFVASEYVGYCDRNTDLGTWKDPSVPFIERIKKKNKPNGQPYKSHKLFLKKWFPKLWLYYLWKPYIGIAVTSLKYKVKK